MGLGLASANSMAEVRSRGPDRLGVALALASLALLAPSVSHADDRDPPPADPVAANPPSADPSSANLPPASPSPASSPPVDPPPANLPPADPPLTDPPPASSRHWDPAWSHAGMADYAISLFAADAIGLYIMVGQNSEPALHWTQPILFDKAFRSLLQGSTPTVRNDAGTASWVGFGAVVGYTLIDVPYAGVRYGPQMAWDLAWQDGTALSLATLVDLTLRDVVGRARPEIYDCLSSGKSTSSCLAGNTEATRSFPGGHVAIVSTAATLTCTQHLALHLYGSPWDAVACASAITADVAVGTLRMVADVHWASDIVVGSGLGFLIGYGVPTLMHLRRHTISPIAGLNVIPVPIAVDRGGGVGLGGSF
jgi:membrane-associated phospholipid phosphatase